MSKSEVTNQVLNFLVKENRPYSANELLEKCGKDIGKTALQKALDNLADKEKIVEKTFGKQKIYFPRQQGELKELKRELQVFNQKLLQSQQNLKKRQSDLRESELKLRVLSNLRSVESLQEEREQLAKEICAINEKLRRCEANAVSAKFTPAAVQRIEKHYEKVATAFRKRKRICADLLDAIMEGYPKSKKALIEDIGIETDEAVGFKLEIKR